MKSKATIRRVSWSALALGLCVACSNQASTTGAQLAEGCYINTDCSKPLVCAFMRCHSECMTSRDCPGDARCVASDRPFNVCQLGVEKQCTYNSMCPMGQICGVDGQCRDECKTDGDCVKGQVCTQGTCADTTELLDSGKLPIATDDSGAAGDGGAPSTVSCLYNSDCPSGLICNNQVCVPECKEDVDCIFRGAGYSCLSGRCLATSSDAASDASTQDSTAGDAGRTCTYHSDCTPQICQAGVCIDQCHADVDCAAGQKCAANVCVAALDGPSSQPDATLADGSACTYSSDCTPQICRAGVCIDQCHADVDCAPGETCSASHVCSLPEASVPPDAPTGYAASCVYNSDCAYPLVCKASGSCGYQCLTNLDCPPGNFCNGNHQCIAGAPPPVDAGPHDSGPADGAAEAGKQCSYNSDCTDGVWCDGYETCVLGHCYPPAITPCGTSATCIQTSCNEANHTCSQTVIGSTDADGDGHYDQACGGDDCNDNDSTIYAGHPELCDGKDNDCNGLVDDYAVVARGTEYTSVAGAAIGSAYGLSYQSQLWTAPFGTGLIGGWLAAGSPLQVKASTMTTAGVAGPVVTMLTPSGYPNNSRLVGMGGNTAIAPSAVMVFNDDVSGNALPPLLATVVNPVSVDGGTSLAATAPVTLVPYGSAYAYNSWVNEADVDWVPSSSTFLVSWSRLNTSNLVTGYFTTLATDGTQATSATAVPTAPASEGGSGTGVIGTTGYGSVVYLRSAASGSVFGFFYGEWIAYYSSSVATLYLTSASGNVIAGPISLPGMPLDIAPFAGGFATLTQTSGALIITQISSTGAVLASVSASSLGASAGLVATDARGAPDADGGILFAVRMASGFNTSSSATMRLVRARLNSGGTFDPMETTSPIVPTTATVNDHIDLSALSDGRVAVSYWEPGADSAAHVRIVSCLP